MRVVSMQSKAKVYHREECRYAKKILPKNRMQLSSEAAEKAGYHICPYCDGMDALFRMKKEQILKYARKNHMEVDLLNHVLYVRTDVGCWKMIYSMSEQRFLLYHKNYMQGVLSLDEVEEGAYHRQRDVPFLKSIEKYLFYISKHDAARKIEMIDYRLLPNRTKKEKRYFASARARSNRRSQRRLEELFTMIEQGA